MKAHATHLFESPPGEDRLDEIAAHTDDFGDIFSLRRYGAPSSRVLTMAIVDLPAPACPRAPKLRLSDIPPPMHD